MIPAAHSAVTRSQLRPAMVSLDKPPARVSPCQSAEMSCRQDISHKLFQRIPPRTVRIRSAVLAFASTGYMRGCRPTPRRAAASSTAYPFAPKSPPGDFAFPVSPESGGNGLCGGGVPVGVACWCRWCLRWWRMYEWRERCPRLAGLRRAGSFWQPEPLVAIPGLMIRTSLD